MAIIGGVAVALMIGSFYVTWAFLNRSFDSGIPVRAVFSAPGVGQQLPVGGDVKVRGALVGRISEITLQSNGEAVVEFRLEPDLRIPIESAAEIRSKTVFGQKWIELLPTTPSAPPYLGPGDTIPDSKTREPLELERTLQLADDLLVAVPAEDLATVFEALADGFAGHEANARKAMDEGLIALRAVNASAGDLDLSLRQLSEFSAWLDENDETILDFMDGLDSANRALVGAAPEFKSSIQSVPTFLNDLARFQESIETDLGRLVEDGATLAEIIAARSARLGDLVRNLEAFTTVWNSGLSQPCEGPFESDMTCWQIYIPPGLESRGLYETGESPLINDQVDPNGADASPGIAATARELPSDLARVLHAPILEQLGLSGSDRDG